LDESGIFTPGGVSPIYGSAISGARACMRDWHLVYRAMYDLCTHPALSESMAAIMGPDLLLWRSQFQYKDAGQGPVAWHQDAGFPGHLLRPALNPVKNISAWIAIEEATLANGCVRLVPGTHRQHIDRRFKQADRGEGISRSKIRNRVCRRHEQGRRDGHAPRSVLPVQREHAARLHRESDRKRRLGLSVRVTTPEVKVYEGQEIDGNGYNLENFGCILMRGEDRYGYNRYITPNFID
jgi:hypothetical protein